MKSVLITSFWGLNCGMALPTRFKDRYSGKKIYSNFLVQLSLSKVPLVQRRRWWPTRSVNNPCQGSRQSSSWVKIMQSEAEEISFLFLAFQDSSIGDHVTHFKSESVSQSHTWYLSFFLHGQNFWRIKFTPKKCVNYDKIHSKLPIFYVITAKYTVNCRFFALNL